MPITHFTIETDSNGLLSLYKSGKPATIGQLVILANKWLEFKQSIVTCAQLRRAGGERLEAGETNYRLDSTYSKQSIQLIRSHLVMSHRDKDENSLFVRFSKLISVMRFLHSQSKGWERAARFSDNKGLNAEQRNILIALTSDAIEYWEDLAKGIEDHHLPPTAINNAKQKVKELKDIARRLKGERK